MIKVLENETSIVFNLILASNAILLYFFFFYLITNLNILILAVIAQNFNTSSELTIPNGTPTNKANGEIETKKKFKII